jgi:hypothetical protein
MMMVVPVVVVVFLPIKLSLILIPPGPIRFLHLVIGDPVLHKLYTFVSDPLVVCAGSAVNSGCSLSASLEKEKIHATATKIRAVFCVCFWGVHMFACVLVVALVSF